MTTDNTQAANKTVVTVPDYFTVAEVPLPLTDYAVDNGASYGYRDKEYAVEKNANQEYRFGAVWVQPTNNGLLGTDTCAWARREGAHRTLNMPTDKGVGVAPCLKNPSADNFGVMTDANGVTILTHENEPVYYPRTRVSDELKNELLMARDGQDLLQMVGAYLRPTGCRQAGAILKTETDICYAYRGRCYVNCENILTKRDDWYLCEPVRVLAETGAERIQCAEVLINAPFDNMDHFAAAVKARDFTFDGAALFDFANDQLLNDWKLSTDLNQFMKLTHTRDSFAANNLKENRTADNGLVR